MPTSFLTERVGLTDRAGHRTLNSQLRVRSSGDDDDPAILAHVSGIAIPWDEVYDSVWGPERVDPAAMSDVGVLVGRALTDNHRDAVGVIRSATITDVGLEVTGDVLATSRGHDVNLLLRKGPTSGMSIGFNATDGHYDDDDVWVWTDIDIREVALTHMPAYQTAEITEIRSGHHVNPRSSTPSAEASSDDTIDLTEHARIDVVEERIERLLDMVQERQTATTPRPNALQRVADLQAKYRSAHEWMLAERQGEQRMDLPLFERALATITTADLTGLDSGWALDLVTAANLGRPFITAIGASALPETGMETHYAELLAADGTSELSAAALVGTQSAELAEITSAKFTIKPAKAAVRTIAGGSKISMQDLDRLGAAFQQTYWETMAWAWSVVSEASAITAVANTSGLAAATTYTKGDATTYGDALRVGMAKVARSTGANPTVALVGETIYNKISAAKDTTKRKLYPMYGPTNASGISTIDTLTIEGVPHIMSPYMAPDDVLVTNSIAVKVKEDGLRQISVDDVAHLGKDCGVYNYQATEVRKKAGVVIIREAAA